MSDQTLCHYTIDTGHGRDSPRSEVSPDALAVCRALLRLGTHRLPIPGGYSVRVERNGPWLAATVLGARGAPLVSLHVVRDPVGLRAVLDASGCRPVAPITLPAALVETLPGLALDASATEWLGDFERCLAWAWLDSVAN
jgi:hypothetical protein